MKTGRKGALPGAVLVSILVCGMSCKTVKEDRQACPCVLSVEMKGLPAYPVALFVNGSAAGEAQGDTTLLVRVEGGGTATVMAVSGAVPSGDGEVWIPYGEQSPPLYSFFGQADCTGESAQLEVRMRKHFCTLGVRFSGPEGWGTPLQAALRGSVGGLSPETGTPLSGAFRAPVQGTSARLPRQESGDPLWLDIMFRDSVLRSFPLGTYLEKAGYDWAAADLPDTRVEVDISVTSVRFTTPGWTTGRDIEIRI